MKNTFLLLLLLIPCYLIAQDNTQAQKDSLRAVINQTTDGKEKIDSYKRLTNIYYFEALRDELKKDTLFALYDKMDAEAEKLNNDGARAVLRVNKLNVLNGTQKYDEVIKLAPVYLAFIEKMEMWNAYFQLYTPWINSYRNQGKEKEALELAQNMYDYAKKINNDTGKGTALFNMAIIYGNQYRFTEQEQCYREAITLLQDIPALNLLASCYDKLSSCLVAQKRFDEAILIADETENIINRYEEATGVIQTNARTNRFMVYRGAYYQSGQYDKAEYYCNKLDSISNGKIKSYEERSGIFASRGQYKEALEMADKNIEIAGPKFKAQAIGAKMMVLLRKEGTEALEQTFRDAVGALIEKHKAEFNTQLDEIRTQYEVDKITAEKERITIEKERNRNYFLFSLGGCILLSITLGIWIYYNRTILRKNKALYRQIKEQDRLEEELKQITADDDSNKVIPGDRQQRQLVARFNEFLLNERNYAKPEINLDELISELATNRTYLFEAVKNVTKKTPLDYIHSLKLEEAKQMLETRLDLNIETISEGCGFVSRSTFHRLFRARYSITPAEYRKMTLSE